MKGFVCISVLFFVVVSVVDCQKWSYNRSSRAENKSSGRNGGSYFADSLNGRSTESNPPSKLQQSNKSTSRGGIGAWGYVSIALTVILSGLGVYYFVIFYPIVCKKERMYDVMEMTTV